MGVLNAVVERARAALEEEVKAAGFRFKPTALLNHAKRVAAVAAAASVIIAAALGGPAAAAALAAPLFALAAPFVVARFAKLERKEGVERELPFFAILAAVLGRLGAPLHVTMREAASWRGFKWMRKEAELAAKSEAIEGVDFLEALERRAYEHPSAEYRSYVLGYGSVWRDGGDTASYLRSAAERLVDKVKFKLSLYRERAGLLGEAGLTITVLASFSVPLAAMFVPSLGWLLITYPAIVLPALTALLILIADRIQVEPNEYKRVPAVSLAAALAAAAVAALAGLRPWVVVGAALLTLSVAAWLEVRDELRESWDVESDLSRFLRFVTERRKLGLSISEAVRGAVGEKFTKAFKRLLAAVSLRVSLGLRNSDVRTGSWLARFAVFTLGEVEAHGAGAEALEMLTDLTTRVVDARSEVKDELRVLTAVGVASPLVLALTLLTGMKFVSVVWGQLAPALAETAHWLAEYVPLTVVVNGFCVGLLCGKLSSGTVRDTRAAAAAVAVALASVAALGYPLVA